jgi:hypothetical protein
VSPLDRGNGAVFEVTCLELATRFPQIIENYEPSYDRAIAAVRQSIWQEGSYSESPNFALASLIRFAPRDDAVDLALETISNLLATKVIDDPLAPYYVASGVTLSDQFAARMVGIILDALPENELPRLKKRILRYRVPHSNFEAFQALSMRYLREGRLSEAIQIAAKIPNEVTRHKLFARLAKGLDLKHLEQVRKLIARDWAKTYRRTSYTDPRAIVEARADTLSKSAAGIASRLAQLGRHDEAIDLIRDIAPRRGSAEWKEALSNASAALDRGACMQLLEVATKFDFLDETVLRIAYLCPFFAEQDLLERLPAFRLIGYFDKTVTRISLLRKSRSRGIFPPNDPKHWILRSPGLRTWAWSTKPSKSFRNISRRQSSIV